MMNNTNMGEVGNMIVANGLTELYSGGKDIDPYSAFDDVLDADGGVVDIDFSEFRSGASRRARSRMGGKEERQRKMRKAAGYHPVVAASRAIKRNQQQRRTREAQEGRSRSDSGVFGRAGQAIKGGFQNWRDQRNREAEQQQALIAQAQSSAPTAEQLNALLAPSTATVQTQQNTQKMSPTLKWGLIIGGVAIAGIAGYFIYKKMKNKTK